MESENEQNPGHLPAEDAAKYDASKIDKLLEIQMNEDSIIVFLKCWTIPLMSTWLVTVHALKYAYMWTAQPPYVTMAEVFQSTRTLNSKYRLSSWCSLICMQAGNLDKGPINIQVVYTV